MEAKDVTSLTWRKVRDWSGLTASYTDGWGESFVSETDVNVFVTNLYRGISRKLNIPYEQLEPILKAENEAFYTLKEKIFEDSSYYAESNSKLIGLENTLRVPKNFVTEDKVKVSECLNLFNKLPDSEKLEFLNKIGMIKLQIVPVHTEKTIE